MGTGNSMNRSKSSEGLGNADAVQESVASVVDRRSLEAWRVVWLNICSILVCRT